jgi:U6 snRNA-associated Sm-like protein LSm1
VLIVLRDGRHIIGKLASYDQYGSIVMERSKERHFAQVRESLDANGERAQSRLIPPPPPTHLSPSSPPTHLSPSPRPLPRPQGKYCDVEMGIYLIRGENITLIGEVDPVADAANPLLQPGTWDEVRALEEEEEAKQKARAAGVGGAAGAAAAAAAAAGEVGVRVGWVME